MTSNAADRQTKDGKQQLADQQTGQILGSTFTTANSPPGQWSNE